MDGGMGIIGLPGDGTVMKYVMSGDRSVELMSDERQTLMGTSITQEDGVTIMEFTKYLREDGENAILANGENTFLYALGAINELLYHSSGRGSFVLDFGTTLPTETTTAMETASSTEAEGKHLSCFLYADVGLYTYFLTSLTQIPKDLVSETPSTCTSIESIKCFPVTISENLPPKLDGYADEWEFVEVFETPLAGVLNSQRQYPHGNGNVQIQCVYDTEKVYFLFHVPGPHRSSTEENRKNAAMSMVFKMGEMATLPDMVSALPTYE
jgi:hypothetical protein